MQLVEQCDLKQLIHLLVLTAFLPALFGNFEQIMHRVK